MSRRRLRITGATTEDARQKKATAARRRGRRLSLGRLQFSLQLLGLLGELFVLFVEALDGCLLHQNRLGHEIARRWLASQVLLDPRFGLGVARG